MSSFPHLRWNTSRGAPIIRKLEVKPSASSRRKVDVGEGCKTQSGAVWVPAAPLVLGTFPLRAQRSRVCKPVPPRTGDTGSTGRAWGCLIFPTQFALSWRPGGWPLLGRNPSLKKDSRSEVKRQWSDPVPFQELWWDLQRGRKAPTDGPGKILFLGQPDGTVGDSLFFVWTKYSFIWEEGTERSQSQRTTQTFFGFSLTKNSRWLYL